MQPDKQHELWNVTILPSIVLYGEVRQGKPPKAHPFHRTVRDTWIATLYQRVVDWVMAR
jgi:hypothetical protein